MRKVERTYTLNEKEFISVSLPHLRKRQNNLGPIQEG